MGKRAAICIGVNRAGTMRPLQAAARGATDFAAWATAQGCDVATLVDEPNKPVALVEIFDEVQKVVASGTYEQLVIYFSGHGILSAPGTEYWLLSRAPANPNEAVNLFRSIEDARNSGIPHVIFISDACRSSVTGPPLSAVLGGVIFSPNRSAQRSEVDVYYATHPGDPAYEVAEAEATQRFRGVFTDCLLRLVKEPPAEIVEQIPLTPPIHVITTRMLKPRLESLVPQDVAAADVRLRQMPEIRAETALPKFFARVERRPPATPEVSPPAPPAPAPAPRGARPDGPSRPRRSPPGAPSPDAGAPPPSPTAVPSLPRLAAFRPVATLDRIFSALRAKHIDGKPVEYEEVAGLEPEPPTPKSKELRLAGEIGLTDEINRLATSRGRARFETMTGFTVHGTPIVGVDSTHWNADPPFAEAAIPGALHIRLHPQTPDAGNRITSILLEFPGCGACVPIASEFIGTIVVDRGRVVSLSYAPSEQSWRYAGYANKAKHLDEIQAFAAVASRNGSFWVASEKADTFADRVRQDKGIDPTMGLYAAYAYAQIGQYDDVASVLSFMKEDPGLPVPFDVVMLAEPHDPNAAMHLEGRIAPFWPLLSQGWALLAPGDPMYRPLHQELRPHLIPSLWTTLSTEGVAVARQLLLRGETP